MRPAWNLRFIARFMPPLRGGGRVWGAVPRVSPGSAGLDPGLNSHPPSGRVFMARTPILSRVGDGQIHNDRPGGAE